MGFLIDLFFSDISTPYTLTYLLIGLYLNFSSLKWVQRSLLEQIILMIAVSLLLNILLFTVNNFSDDMSKRIIINPLMNSIIWVLVFINQSKKWLKNI
jgi:rod shape-determining protein MreD